MKFTIEKAKDLAKISTVGRNGVYLLHENVDVEVHGQIEIKNPIKVSGSTSFTGADGSSLIFTEKGSINCSTNARRLCINDLTLRSESDKPIFGIAQNTARSLVLHRVAVDGLALGQCKSQNITMSQCSFLNADMSPMVLGNYVDSLVLSGIRHDGVACLLDGCQTSFDGVGLIADVYIKCNESGLLLLNDKSDAQTDRRYSIPHNSFILTNIQGLNRDLDVFRQKLEKGYVTSLDYKLTEQYVI